VLPSRGQPVLRTRRLDAARLAEPGCFRMRDETPSRLRACGTPRLQSRPGLSSTTTSRSSSMLVRRGRRPDASVLQDPL
jgi:hypothetical protein